MNNFTMIPYYAVLAPQVTYSLPPSLTGTTGMEALTHAVAHSLGGQYNIPHGLANSELMPIALEKYGKSVYKQSSELAVVADLCTEETSIEKAAKLFISEIKQLNKKMKITEK